MTVTTMLMLLVSLLLVIVGLAFVVGLGYAVHRRPALAQPIGVAIAAAGVLAALVVGIVQAATS
ncbi:hypothetical protein [Streptomyces sp. NPDC005890]|uniref:hypothetical protein n=1 Tax=Streptomyces sp. NPDC005890 TaxID=3154568 RepID=UPI0033C296AF